MNTIKIMLVDDHALIRQGLGKILGLDPELEIVTEAADGAAAVASVRQHQPDVVLMDINMPVMNGLEATRIIKQEYPEIGVIALTIHDDEEYVFELVNIGVSGYVLKDVEAETLIDAVKQVAAGKSIIHPDITAKLLDEFKRLHRNETDIPKLTSREKEVLQSIVKGLSNKAIGEQLYISEKTVKNHITNILRKLDLHDRTQAAIFAVKNNLVKV